MVFGQWTTEDVANYKPIADKRIHQIYCDAGRELPINQPWLRAKYLTETLRFSDNDKNTLNKRSAAGEEKADILNDLEDMACDRLMHEPMTRRGRYF